MFCLYVCLCEDVWFSGTGVTATCELPYGCWELNLGLWKSRVLLSTEPTLQSQPLTLYVVSISLNPCTQHCNSHTSMRHCPALLDLEHHWTAFVHCLCGLFKQQDCGNMLLNRQQTSVLSEQGHSVILDLHWEPVWWTLLYTDMSTRDQDSMWLLVLGLQVYFSFLVSLQVWSPHPTLGCCPTINSKL